MNFNFQKARDLMVENQLRPNKIKDPLILEAFKHMPKEDFIPNNLESLTYSDSDITLSNNRGYLKNLHLAQMIKYAELNSTHKVLHIGALTGYFSCILSKFCLKVYAIEIENEYKEHLKKNINQGEIDNIEIVEGSFINGFELNAPFDRIFIDSPINNVNKKLLDQLSDDFGKIIMIKKENENLSQAISITKNGDKYSNEYLFDVFSRYELYSEKKGFVF